MAASRGGHGSIHRGQGCIPMNVFRSLPGTDTRSKPGTRGDSLDRCAELTNVPCCTGQSPVWKEPRLPVLVPGTNVWVSGYPSWGVYNEGHLLPIQSHVRSHRPPPPHPNQDSCLDTEQTLVWAHQGLHAHVHDRWRPLLPPDARAGNVVRKPRALPYAKHNSATGPVL